jgi:DnaK suppressor protein
MTKEKKKELSAIIAKKISRLEAEVDEMSALIQPISPDNSIGRVSRMDAIVNKSVLEASLNAKNQKLALLKEARRDMDKPNFGICESCDRPIRFERLKIMPESKRCMQCLSR